jgi:hypothetical protein
LSIIAHRDWIRLKFYLRKDHTDLHGRPPLNRI